MAQLTKEGIEDATPAMVKAGEGIENGIMLLTIHQGQITKAQGLPTDQDRIVNRPLGKPKRTTQRIDDLYRQG